MTGKPIENKISKLVNKVKVCYSRINKILCVDQEQGCIAVLLLLECSELDGGGIEVVRAVQIIRLTSRPAEERPERLWHMQSLHTSSFLQDHTFM